VIGRCFRPCRTGSSLRRSPPFRRPSFHHRRNMACVGVRQRRGAAIVTAGGFPLLPFFPHLGPAPEYANLYFSSAVMQHPRTRTSSDLSLARSQTAISLYMGARMLARTHPSPYSKWFSLSLLGHMALNKISLIASTAVRQLFLIGPLRLQPPACRNGIHI